MNNNFDILKDLEDLNDSIEQIKIEEINIENEKIINYSYEIIVTEEKKEKRWNIFSWTIFLLKYSITCSSIFLVLLISTNYSAYYNVAKSYVLKWQVKETQNRLLNSVEASNLKEKTIENIIEIKEEEKSEDIIHKTTIEKYKKDVENEELKINIEITPYENRVIIPKIGKNIPLIDVKNRVIEDEKELDDIFMEELENGIVRYPGSSKPWEVGTSFIFWHSSNFPWIDWDFNDVFSTLDNVAFWDEVIVYYGQKKHTYKIREKRVIKPGDVSVLERDKWLSEITLMTCWPIGTTLNRLIVTWELVEEN